MNSDKRDVLYASCEFRCQRREFSLKMIGQPSLHNLKGGSHFVSRIKNRGAIWFGAHVTLYCWDKIFDFVLYPLAIMNFGLIWGTVSMMSASLIICVALLAAYDRLGDTRFRDLLGFETMKEVAFNIGQSRLVMNGGAAQHPITRRLVKIGVFLYLSAWFDAMTCIIFMRPPGLYSMNGMYWSLFLISVGVSNIVWALLVYFGVETVQALVEELFWKREK